MVSPALQRGEKGFHKFVTESRRDGARTLFMHEPIAPEECLLNNHTCLKIPIPPGRMPNNAPCPIHFAFYAKWVGNQKLNRKISEKVQSY